MAKIISDADMEKRMEEFSGKLGKLIDGYYKNNKEEDINQLDFELIALFSSIVGWIVQVYPTQDVQLMLSDFSEWVWNERAKLQAENKSEDIQ